MLDFLNSNKNHLWGKYVFYFQAIIITIWKSINYKLKNNFHTFFVNFFKIWTFKMSLINKNCSLLLIFFSNVFLLELLMRDFVWKLHSFCPRKKMFLTKIEKRYWKNVKIFLKKLYENKMKIILLIYLVNISSNYGSLFLTKKKKCYFLIINVWS